ncbi:MAG: TonB-dependent receptor [Bacteroidales bacterium]|nr:TonB-dependent receptor [Bacteroidales bacterium]
MMKNIIPILLPLLIFTTSLCAQQDTIQMKEIEITSSRIPQLYSENIRILHIIDRAEIESGTASTLTDLLSALPSVDIRQRGAAGVQGDLSMRGGTFEQTMILIDGVQMNDPQTGHHSLSLPVDLDAIERIEILEGPGSRIFGPNAFSGAINIITRKQGQNKLKVGLSAGEYGLNDQSIGLSIGQKRLTNHTQASRSSSHGYITNTDFNQLQLMSRFDLSNKLGNWSLMGGLADKAFGAYKFYTGTYPWQFEQLNTRMANLSYALPGKISVKANAYWRRNNDRFELFREGPDWYVKQGDVFVRGTDTAGFRTVAGLIPYAGHNYHRTDVYGIETNLSHNGRFSRSAVGLSWRSEHILSNVLGEKRDHPKPVNNEDALFTYGKSRDNLNVFAEYGIFARKISLSAGMLAYWSSAYGWYVHPGLDAGFAINTHWRVFASANPSLRLPTFTDLYYKGPVNQANPDLKPETSMTWESGLKFNRKQFSSSLALFLRDGKNIIDWVRPSDSVKWISMNHTEVRTVGAEWQLTYSEITPGKLLMPQRAGLALAYYDNSKQSGDFQSAYALDYVKFKISLGATHRLPAHLSLAWNLTYREREGGWYDAASKQTIAYEPLWLLDARISWSLKRWKVFASVSNLLDNPYFDIANVQMPGRWVSAGLTYEINFE